LGWLTRWAADGIVADLTVLLDVPAPLARRRLDPGRADRLEQLDADFHERVRAGYLALARADPESWVVVDGTASVDVVAEQLLAVVAERLGRPESAAP
jgi:dTMP kinase